MMSTFALKKVSPAGEHDDSIPSFKSSLPHELLNYTHLLVAGNFFIVYFCMIAYLCLTGNFKVLLVPVYF